ncbi:MAG: hypothetical protein IIA67_01365 [Planctomycetes bacterium]|nr:hypothetical protein [Planctomycetota bacterium]
MIVSKQSLSILLLSLSLVGAAFALQARADHPAPVVGGPTIGGAQSVVLTNNRGGITTYNEINVFADGVDIASAANGATATSTDGPPFTWGPGPIGAIDDVIDGGCCDGLFHGQDAGGDLTEFTINFDGAHNVDLMEVIGRIGCCPERTDDFDVDFYSGPDGTGNLLLNFNVVGLGGADSSDAAAGSRFSR